MTKKPYTAKQGQYLAFIFYYTKIHRCAPAESDIQNYFKVSPPSIHQMVLTLESNGFNRAGSGAGSVDSSADPSGGPARFGIGVTPCTATCAVAFEPPVSGSRHIRQARID